MLIAQAEIMALSATHAQAATLINRRSTLFSSASFAATAGCGRSSFSKPKILLLSKTLAVLLQSKKAHGLV